MAGDVKAFETLFQLTRSRGARLVQPLVLAPPCDISTHALTWSATDGGGALARGLRISTHALTWSATRL